MNKEFHQTVSVISLSFMPKEFKDFLISGDYSISSIQNDSIISDQVDKDNIESNPFQQHVHSYKMENKNGILAHVDGDLITKIHGMCMDCNDLYKEGKLDMVRYTFSKISHFCIDINSIPHLFVGDRWGDYHARFEKELGNFIKLNGNKIKDIKITQYKDLDNELENYAKEMWLQGNNILNRDTETIKLTDEEKMDICQRCVDMICSIWTMIGIEIGIIKKNK